ncbi:Serine hydrolase [uncultured archaeon]|nr:Serine hydrolase [uncultured archaeon]
MHGWRTWLKEELEKIGFEVVVPAMPSPDAPKVEEWIAAVEKAVGDADEFYLVGHSLGCPAILRYLEKTKKRAGGAVLVAGFAEKLGEDFKELDGFVEKPFEWQEIRKNCGRITAIFSDNDPYIPLSQVALFEKELSAKCVVLHKRGHFSSSEGTVKLPEALDALLEMCGC